MGSVWTLHSTLVGASSWLLLWALFSVLFPVFSDVLKSEKEWTEQHSDRDVVKDEETLTDRLTGLGMERVNGVVSRLPECLKLADSKPLALHSRGDVVIGGLFPLHYVAPKPQHSYRSKPELAPCSG